MKLSGLSIVLADIEPMLTADDKREIIEHARLRARLAQGHQRAAELDETNIGKGARGGSPRTDGASGRGRVSR